MESVEKSDGEVMESVSTVMEIECHTEKSSDDISADFKVSNILKVVTKFKLNLFIHLAEFNNLSYFVILCPNISPFVFIYNNDIVLILYPVRYDL